MKYLLMISLPFLIWSCNGNKHMNENGQPQWVVDKIDSFKKDPVQDPPATIQSYEYKGKKVYYINSPCCDQYNYLYDHYGYFICYPDGGLTGKGDGNCPDFHDKKTNEQLVWRDERAQ